MGMLLLMARGKPTIVSQPAGQSVKEGLTATFTVTARDADRFQWQRSDDNGSNWSNVGTSQNSYTTPAVTIAADDQDLYRCQVSNEAGTATTAAARLEVTAGAGPE